MKFCRFAALVQAELGQELLDEACHRDLGLALADLEVVEGLLARVVQPPCRERCAEMMFAPRAAGLPSRRAAGGPGAVRPSAARRARWSAARPARARTPRRCRAAAPRPPAPPPRFPRCAAGRRFPPARCFPRRAVRRRFVRRRVVPRRVVPRRPDRTGSACAGERRPSSAVPWRARPVLSLALPVYRQDGCRWKDRTGNLTCTFARPQAARHGAGPVRFRPAQRRACRPWPCGGVDRGACVDGPNGSECAGGAGGAA